MGFNVGLIRVLTISDEKMLNLHGNVIQQTFPELKVTSRCIENQPYGIYDSESEKEAEPKIMNLIKFFEQQKYDAVIISCAADPAVSMARRNFRIPVIGAGSAVAALAISVADKIGVLNLTERTPPIIKEILGKRLVAEVSPKNVRNTLDLLGDQGRKSALDAVEKLIREGVETIILACTGYTTIGFKKIIARHVDIPVLDAVVAAGAVALSVLKQREVDRYDN